MTPLRGSPLPRALGFALRGVCAAGVALMVAGLTSPRARGQAVYFTWSDASGTNNYASTATNWVGNATPSASQSNLLNIVFDGAQTSAPAVNVDSSLTLNSIRFQGSTGFGINPSNGSSITFTGGTGGGVTSGVFSTSTSSSSVLVTLPIVLQGAITVSNTSTTAGLIMTGGLSGSGDITIVNSGTYPVQFSGIDSRTSGTTIIQSGVFQVGNLVSTTAVLAGNVTNSGQLIFGPPTSGSVGFTGNISGTGAVTIGGSSGANATFTLSGTNSYTGATTVSNVTLADTSSLASFSPGSALSVNSGGTVSVNSNETVGGLQGSGTVNLASGVSLLVSTTGIPGSFTGAINGTSDAGVTIGGTGTTTFGGSSSYTGGTTIASGATFVVKNSSGSATGTGAVTITSGGTFQIGAVGGGVTGAVSGTIVDNGTLTFGNGTSTNPIVVSNPITGTGIVTVPNSTAADLTSDSNTYSGGTTVSNGGTLIVSNPTDTASATGTGTVTVASGGTLDFGFASGSATGGILGAIVDSGVINFNLTSPSTFSNTVSGTGTVNDNLAGTLTYANAGSKTYTGITTIASGATIADAAAGAFPTGSTMTVASGGTLQSGYNESLSGLTGSGTVNLTSAAATLTLTNTAAQTFAGTLTGSGNLKFSGSSSEILTGSNTYSGSTTITSGTLVAANTAGSATGSGAITIASGTGLEFGLSTGSASGAVSGSIIDNGGVVFDLTSDSSFSNAVSGTGGLSINKNAVLTITGGTGNLTYSGTTFINAGKLADQAGVPNALSPNSVVTISAGASLDIDSNETVKGISGRSGAGGSIAIGSGAILTLANSNSLAFQGIISGSGGIETSGLTGTTILTNANTFTGNAIIDAGSRLRIGDGTSTTASLAAPIVDNGTLILSQVASGSNVTFANAVSGSGTVSVISTSTLILPNANTYSGGTSMTSNGQLILTNSTGSALGSGTVTIGSATPTSPYSGATLGGSGSFAGQLGMTGGSNLYPVIFNSGASTLTPSTLAAGSGATIAGNSSLIFLINNANGAVGTNWDQVTFAGSLSLTATPSAPISISINSVNGSFQAGQALNFDPTKAYSWQFVSAAGGITGFDSTAFSITTSALSAQTPGFANSLGAGSFYISETGNDLFVNFTPIPEPSTWLLMGAGILAIGAGAVARGRICLARR